MLYICEKTTQTLEERMSIWFLRASQPIPIHTSSRESPVCFLNSSIVMDFPSRPSVLSTNCAAWLMFRLTIIGM